MELLDYIWNNPIIKLITLSLLGLFIVTFIILLLIHLTKVRQGRYSKFFWIESGLKEGRNQEKAPNQIKGKNINTGTNYGKIGDD